MEFKGTKGKWEYTGGDNLSVDIVLENNSTISIDRLNRYDEGIVCTRQEMNANALLISKAPEMLEMLKDIKDYLGSDKREEVEKLIKEATEI